MARKITFLILIFLCGLTVKVQAQILLGAKIQIEYRGNESQRPINPIVIICSDSTYYIKNRDTGDIFYYNRQIFSKLYNYILESISKKQVGKDQFGDNRFTFILILDTNNKRTYYLLDSKKKSINFLWNLTLFVNEMNKASQNNYLIYCLQRRIARIIGVEEFRKKYNRFFNTITCY